MNGSTEAIYSDKEGNLTDKEKAEHVELAEYDENGKRVRTVYGRWIKVPSLEEIEELERRESKVTVWDVFAELEGKLALDIETDKEVIAELYEKYKNFSDIDTLLGNLFHYHLRRRGSIKEDDFFEKSKLMRELSAYFRDNIREASPKAEETR